MNKLLLGSFPLVALVTCVPAHAADLAPAPAYKAPVVAPVQSYNWSGFYFGGNIGGEWENVNRSSSDATTGAALGSGGWNPASVTGGLQAGFNWMATPNVVLGLEADVSYGKLTGSNSSTSGMVTYGDTIDWYGTARGRIGYAFNNVLLYGTGGFAWANDQASRTQNFGAINGAVAGTMESTTAIRTGWTAGGGLEYGFAPSWTARLEYLHMDFGTDTFNFPLSQRNLSLGSTVDLVRTGLNYKFDWGR